MLAAAVATALIAAPLAPAFAQAATEKSEQEGRQDGPKAKKEAHPAAAEDEGLRAEVGGLQKGKERQGPRRIPQVHEHLPEGLSGLRADSRLTPPKRTEGVDETLSLFDALCRLSVSGGLRSILHQLVTLTETV